ncbi:MAG: tetratricopeptide repeat protein [Bacteroidia bacterium]
MENKKEEKTNLDLDAALVGTTQKAEEFYNKYKKQINISLAAIAIIVVGYISFNMFYIEPKEKEAQAAIFKAQLWFEKDSFETALNGMGDALGFEAIASEYALTKAGNLAHFYAGRCLMELGKYEEAIDHLNDFSTNNELIAPLAEGLKADAYVELGNLEKAAKLYIKAANMSKNKLTSPIFLKKAGQVFEELKEYQDAVKAYENIKTNYFESQEAQDIDRYIARAKTLANQN